MNRRGSGQQTKVSKLAWAISDAADRSPMPPQPIEDAKLARAAVDDAQCRIESDDPCNLVKLAVRGRFIWIQIGCCLDHRNCSVGYD